MLRALGPTLAILGLLYGHASCLETDTPAEGNSECTSCSIYILDLASFAHTHGYPVCNLNKVVVNPTTGVVYLKDKDTGIQTKVSHKFGTHSAPWYLEQVSIQSFASVFCKRIQLSKCAPVLALAST